MEVFIPAEGFRTVFLPDCGIATGLHLFQSGQNLVRQRRARLLCRRAMKQSPGEVRLLDLALRQVAHHHAPICAPFDKALVFKDFQCRTNDMSPGLQPLPRLQPAAVPAETDLQTVSE